MNEPAPREAKTRTGSSSIRQAGFWVAAACYTVVLVIVGTYEHRAPEDAMALGFAIVLEVPLWIGLFLYVLGSLRDAGLSKTIVAGTWAAFALAAAVAIVVPGLFEATGRESYVVALLLPPLFVMYFAAVEDSRDPQVRNSIALVFSGTLFVLFVVIAVQYDADRKRIAEGRRQTEAELAKQEAVFRHDLATQSSVDGLLRYLGDEAPHPEMAMAAIRRLPSRQADVVRLLEKDDARLVFDRLGQFDLRVTPELCEAYRGALDGFSAALQKGEVNWDQAQFQLENVSWFTDGGCDLSAPVDTLAALIRQNDESYALELAAHLVSVGHPRAATGR